MTDFRESDRFDPLPSPEPPAPFIPRAALESVRTRRILAVALDFVAVSFLSGVVYVGLLFLSFGMSLFILPPLFPLVAFFTMA
jgi:hypothetical protein